MRRSTCFGGGRGQRPRSWGRTLAPVALTAALAAAGCANAPIVPPTVSDAKLSGAEISPGESFELSFGLKVDEPAAVKRLYVRGLPQNTLQAGTQVDLPRPQAPSTPYAARIDVQTPAADGAYPLEIVIETPDRSFVAPLGLLVIRDTPSRILHAQFVGGSHAVRDCVGKTKLLELQYAVSDDNGAADFVAPTIAALNAQAKDLVFFPHWAPVAWLNDEPGIVLNKPHQDNVKEEIVSSDIRIICGVPEKSTYEFVIKGRSVSKLTGRSTTSESQALSYYVE